MDRKTLICFISGNILKDIAAAVASAQQSTKTRLATIQTRSIINALELIDFFGDGWKEIHYT